MRLFTKSKVMYMNSEFLLWTAHFIKGKKRDLVSVIFTHYNVNVIYCIKNNTRVICYKSSIIEMCLVSVMLGCKEEQHIQCSKSIQNIQNPKQVVYLPEVYSYYYSYYQAHVYVAM